MFEENRMIYYKTKEEIELIRQSCLLVSDALAHVGSILKPGVTGKEIDNAAETLIRDRGAVPGFKGYRDFPATLCISVNDAVVHGIPKDKPFEDGDIVSVDCGVFMNGFYGDAAYTFAVGNVEESVMQLLEVTKASLWLGIEQAVAGKRIGDIGFAIQSFVERKHKYGVVRELVGHGLGKNLHEAPEVPNYGRKGSGPLMKEGLVIAIEPMVNHGRRSVKQSKDGWTILTKDGRMAAHFEHTVAVGKEQADILSDHIRVEKAIEANANLKSVGVLEEIN